MNNSVTEIREYVVTGQEGKSDIPIYIEVLSDNSIASKYKPMNEFITDSSVNSSSPSSSHDLQDNSSNLDQMSAYQQCFSPLSSKAEAKFFEGSHDQVDISFSDDKSHSSKSPSFDKMLDTIPIYVERVHDALSKVPKKITPAELEIELSFGFDCNSKLFLSSIGGNASILVRAKWQPEGKDKKE